MKCHGRDRLHDTARPQLLRARIPLIDPRDIFCDEAMGFCHADESGAPLYFDDDHLNPRGAKLLAKEVLRIPAEGETMQP
ncbi:SGNH hydrolase domain-containing protein [Cribrihabitans sp. XS_ASV171]